jgi:hopanoid biosynthesis associated protein HpnK
VSREPALESWGPGRNQPPAPSPQPLSKQLIVSADDFGMSSGVNHGIIRAHREGILTDASLMVNGRAFEEAVELARAHPTLSVGLHLMLVQGHATLPATAIPLLADAQGMFSMNPIRSGMRYFFTPGIRAELEREIVAQLDRFESTGLPLSHVDGHLTIHMHPVVIDILMKNAERFRIRAVRVPREPLAAALRFDRSHLARKLFEALSFTCLSRHAEPRLDAAGLRRPQRMFGLHQTGHVSEDYLLAVLRDLPPGVNEIYCHAAVVDDEARRWRPPDYESERELEALVSPRVRAALDQEGIRLTSYRDLAAGRENPESRIKTPEFPTP